MKYRLARFDKHSPAPARDVAELHAELLPTSPVVKLGRPFLEGFYYAILPAAGALFGALALVDETPAGFIVATDDSARFATNAIRGRRLAVARAIVPSMIRSPRRMAAAAEILRLAFTTTSTAGGRPEGEILSMGVRDRFREPQFVARSGLHIAHDLMDDALERLHAVGVSRVRAVVDADNLTAQFFYRGRGWSRTRAHVPGWRSRVVEYAREL